MAPRGYVPVDLIQRYASQGLSEPEIASRLKSHGFGPDQINEAFRIALKEEVSREGPPQGGYPEDREAEPRGGREFRGASEPMGERGPPMERRPPPMERPPQREFEQRGPPRMMRPPQGYPPEQRGPPMQRPPERIIVPRENEPLMAPPERERPIVEPDITLEEVIEGIVADRWEEFEERLSNFEKRDLQLQQQMNDMKRGMADVAKKIKTKEDTLVSKFDEFGDSVLNIEGRIGSIEKVFKDLLPELIDNIRTVSEIAEKKKR